jgi:hypothetical protein
MRAHLLLLVILLVPVSCGKKAPPFLPVPVTPGALRVEEVLVEGKSVLVTIRVPKERFSLKGEEEPWALARLLRRESAEPGEVFEERVAILEEDGLAFGERLTMSDGRVETGRRYLYRVELRKKEDREWAATDLLTVETQPAPGVPGALRVEGRERAVFLSWSPPVDGGPDLEYRVLRREEGGSEAPLGPGPLAGTNFSDTRIVLEREYCYRVVSLRRAGAVVIEGNSTGEKCARLEDRTPPAAPGGLRAVRDSGGVGLTWLPSRARDVRGYNVYRAEKDRGFVRLNDEPVAQARYQDSTAEGGKEYRYGVTAVDSSERVNESPFSDTVTVSPGR